MPETKDMNIEVLTSKLAFEIVNEKILNKNEIDKLLGVLATNGVYAMWVYTLDKIEVRFHEDEEKLKRERIFKFLEKISLLDKFISQRFNFNDSTKEISHLTRDINNLRKELKNLKQELGKLNKELRELRENHKEKQQIEQKQEQISQMREKIQKKEEELQKIQKERNKKFNGFFIEISKEIHKLLFLKQLLEKTLIYARYHAKALEDSNE